MIKIVILKGGIGNQIFQYYLYKYLESKGHTVYYKDDTWKHLSHYGLELDKYFDVKIKKMPQLICLLLRFFWHFFPSKYKAVTSTDTNFDESLLMFDGYWHDNSFLNINTAIRFKRLELSSRNSSILKQIEHEDSVSIHVRRGDYLKPECIKIFGNICTPDYYQQAIEKIKQVYQTPKFYIFSDDIEWCKENLRLNSAIYIDWNKGTDSIYDMYLMSYCRANILANSSFSYWAAKISSNKAVVYPKKWFANKPAPDIFPLNWIGI